MSDASMVRTLPGHSFLAECRDCHEPITMRKTPDRGWLPFEVDPVVLKTVMEGESLIRGGRVIEMLDADDRHRCQRDGRGGQS